MINNIVTESINDLSAINLCVTELLFEKIKPRSKNGNTMTNKVNIYTNQIAMKVNVKL